MGDKSNIQWTDATWNPVTGCSHVSDGCRFCYAETLTRRMAAPRGPWEVPDLPWTAGNAAQNVILHPERLEQPLRWRKPRAVFVNSMSDLFHEQIPDPFVQQVFDVMYRAPQHTFQVLTKRPERMLDVMTELGALYGSARPWPLPNVWLGVSIESRRHVDRADVLRQTPAAHRFISAEPLLGPLMRPWAYEPEWRPGDWPSGGDLPPMGMRELSLEGIDWLIAGGESGQHFADVQHCDRFLIDPLTDAPWPRKEQWIRDLRHECDRLGVGFMFKQWGGRTPKSGGRELDGRTHDWTPAALVTA